MDWWQGFVVVVSLGILRVVVPAGVVALIAYELHRLDAKWHPVSVAGGGD
jgi:hypothetical protein